MFVSVVAVLLVATVACSSGDDDGGEAGDGGEATTTTELASSPACATPPPAATETLEVAVDGTTRTALVHVPASADPTTPAPVVLSFHGATSNAVTMQAMDGLDEKADAEGFVVVHPEGSVVDLPTITGVNGWDLTGATVDDPAFVAALLDQLGAEVCIDPSRVFATGFSLGGEMAMAIACALPDRIAGFSQVGAARSVPCDPGVATPALAFHGTDDLVAPYEGRAADGLLPAEELMAEQAERNGCTGGPEVEQVTPTVETLTWTGCAAPTVLYRLDEHGHAWPGIPLPFPRDLVVATLAGTTDAPNPVPAWAGLTAEQMADNVLLTNTTVNATDLSWALFSDGND